MAAPRFVGRRATRRPRGARRGPTDDDAEGQGEPDRSFSPSHSRSERQHRVEPKACRRPEATGEDGRIESAAPPGGVSGTFDSGEAGLSMERVTILPAESAEQAT